MKKTLILASSLTVAALTIAAAPTQDSLVVHEWGIFTSLQDSFGEVQAGLQHEEEKLPDFVHGRDPLHEERPSDPGTPRPRPRPCRSFKCMEVEPGRIASLGVTQ